MRIKSYIYLLVIFGLFSGCYYTFTEKPYIQIRTIAVKPFENETQQYGIASLTTSLLIQKIQGSSGYSIADEERADGIVEGKIIYYSREVNTYDAQENPLDYIIKVRARVALIERASGKKLFESTFEGFATFPLDGDEDKATNEAVEMLAQRIYEKLKGG